MSRNHKALVANRRWRKARAQAIERDNWRCVVCRKAGRLEVHHIVELKDGGDAYAPSNLMTLCRGCHIAEHGRERSPEVRAWAEWLRHGFLG